MPRSRPSLSEAAQRAWGSGVSGPETAADAPGTGAGSDPAAAGEQPTPPTPEGGLFGLAEPADPDEVKTVEQLDWVSASAWAEAPWDERAELEAEDLEEDELADEEEDEEDEADEDDEADEAVEATQGPRIPAALPMRRRKPPQEPIRSRGSGEWFYADPPGHEPLVGRRYGVTPPILLGVLGILLVSIVVFLVATQIGGGDGPAPVAAASPSAGPSFLPLATRAPTVTAAPSEEPQRTPKPNPSFYRVRSGDSLSGIANKFDVKVNHLQCLNGISDKNLVVVGARLEIPPEGFSCPPGWRNATPEPQGGPS